MRPIEKNKISPVPFNFRAVSEVDRVRDALKKNPPFEREPFNANYSV